MRAERTRTGMPVRRNMIFTVLIILFFVGIITLYYEMLISETRDNIIKNGELNAVNAANRINSYLATGMDSVKLSGYTLDKMIRDKRPQEEILEFMIDQSYAMLNVVAGQINGIYGYINKTYLDGVYWEPYEDFDPTERPWYIAAMAHSGNVVVVDPYVDAKTGDTIITLAKTLGDAKSVVAIDVSIAQLQTTTEEIAALGSSDMEIILSRSYQVIAHSDPGEVGKDYFRRDGTFGSVIVEELRKQPSGESHFSVKYGGDEYIVYAITIKNDWVCLSVTNATSAFQRLRIPLILTIIVTGLIVAVFLFLMIRSIRKDVLARQLRQLADQQTEYALKDQLTGLQNRRAYSEMIARLSQSLPEDFCVVMLDINGLKTVNDTLGHGAGDELISATSQCILSAFSGIDTVYRLGGDEFCVLMAGGEEQAAERLERLDELTANWKGQQIQRVSVSHGLCAASGHSTIEELLQEADRRMYAHKRSYYQTPGRDRRRK